MRMGWWWTVCLENGSEGREGWKCLERRSEGQRQAKPCSAAMQCLQLADGRGLCLLSASPTPPLPPLPPAGLAWGSLTSRKSARKDGGCLPWVLSDYWQQKSSGLTFRHHLYRERHLLSLPPWNSWDPCWSGKALNLKTTAAVSNRS